MTDSERDALWRAAQDALADALLANLTEPVRERQWASLLGAIAKVRTAPPAVKVVPMDSEDRRSAQLRIDIRDAQAGRPPARTDSRTFAERMRDAGYKG